MESCITHSSFANGRAGQSPATERKKRKRGSARKGVYAGAEAESQRLSHISVERNRRRLMNEHLEALRSLMPSSFLHRGDQASVIAAAIEFVKQLEQTLLLLKAEMTTRTAPAGAGEETLSRAAMLVDGFLTSPQTVAQGHVNLKVAATRRAGQVATAIAAMDELRLTVLHLCITSLDAITVLYSFNLKMEEDCRLGSADEVAAVVHQIFCSGKKAGKGDKRE
ncbi:Transcription factor bHLH70 [Apostasia shenzhenica]|uniref:Transcription factor bHLH70 n=1 Tax=Apostasia shenzhenica TaxID=1088818 RepID=A0A2H9ZXN2_9ASPA|nr:Transcription factor bHLH70 [Apostasia shenzhenica]